MPRIEPGTAMDAIVERPITKWALSSRTGLTLMSHPLRYPTLFIHDGLDLLYDAREPLWTPDRARRLLGELPEIPGLTLRHRPDERREHMLEFARALPPNMNVAERLGAGISRLARLGVVSWRDIKDNKNPSVKPDNGAADTGEPQTTIPNRLADFGWTIRRDDGDKNGTLLIPEHHPIPLHRSLLEFLSLLSSAKEPISYVGLSKSKEWAEQGLPTSPDSIRNLAAELRQKLPTGSLITLRGEGIKLREKEEITKD